MAIAMIFRILMGFTAFHYDTNAPHGDPATFAFYVMAVEFFVIEYFFVGLLWIKLALVYYAKDDTLPLSRIKIIDGAVYIGILFTMIYSIAFIIFRATITKLSAAWWEHIWRLFFLVTVLTLALFLGYFGIRLILQLSSERSMDEVLKKKIKNVLILIYFLGTCLWILNLLYLTIGYGNKPQDWINLIIYLMEILNIFYATVILGRTNIFIRIRIFFGFPEMIEDKTSSSEMATVTSSSYKGESKITKEASQTLDNSFIDISVDQDKF